MDYAGKPEALFPDGQFSNGPGGHAATHVLANSVHAHAPADAILVPDAHLLFNADFQRSGVDLILSDADQKLVLHDYFKGEKRAPLASPDGAHLTGDVVNALAGSVEVSQAGAGAVGGQVIGHVTKLAGTATAIRNGVSIILHQGDNVEKGDVVQSGSDSTLGITFVDGTVFGLSSNARMVLNEMVYDPNGSSNSTLFSLVAGTISFVAGQTAKHGDMKIDTPVATMGIRGTAVLVQIDFTVPGQGDLPNAKFQVLVEPDGTTGSYILFDKGTLQPIAVVNQAGQQINITNGVVSQSNEPLSPELQKLINQVFSQKFGDNSDPKTFNHFTDVGVLPTGLPIQFANNSLIATPIYALINPFSGPTPPTFDGLPNIAPANIPFHLTGFFQAVMSGPADHHFFITELAGKTGDSNSADQHVITTTINFVDPNAGDTPSVKDVKFSSYAYTHNGNAGLNAQQLADIAALEAQIKVVPGPFNNNTGNATLTYTVPDSALDFLAAGETLTLTYVARVDNNYGPADEATLITFTITITGSNDAPKFTSGTPTVDLSGGKSVPGGALTAHDATSGVLNFTDVDLTDTHTVSTKLDKAVMSDGSAVPPGPLDLLENALTATIGADSTGNGVGAVDWQFAQLPVYLADFIPAGQTLIVTYDVTVTDSQGATTTQTVEVKITGTDNPAVVWIHTTTPGSAAGGLWSTASNWETGLVPTANDDVIVITDQLHGLTPSFPVVIDAPAFAKSLTMNDFGNAPPEVINESTLSIGGALNLSADSILENFGMITLGGLAEILNKSVLQNSGVLVLDQGGDFKDQSSITNTGTIEVKGGTLNVSVDIANSGDGKDLIQVDGPATLVLNGGGISGGTVTINGTLDLNGTSFLKNGTLNDNGTVTIALDSVATFDGETVNNSGLLDIVGALTLEHHTTVTNLISASLVKVGAGASLTLLDTSSIVGGELDNAGTVHVDGASGALLDGVDVKNAATGEIMVDVSGSDTPSKLIVDDGTTIEQGMLVIGSVGTFEVSTGGATLSGVTVDNSGLIQVDAGSSLTLNGKTAISGGIITIAGALSSEEEGPSLPPAALDVAGTVTFDGVTIANSGLIDITGALTAELATTISNLTAISAVTVEAAASLTLKDTSSIVGGTLYNSGTVHVDGASGALLDGVDVKNAATGKITVDASGEAASSKLIVDDGTIIESGTLSIGGVGILEVSSVAGATLAGVTVDNSNLIQVDSLASLTLNGDTTISGGAVTVAGSLESEDSSFVPQGMLDVTGTVTLDGVAVRSGGLIDITGALTAEHGTMITNHDQASVVTVASEASLTLKDTSGITGGELANYGTIHVDDASGARLDGVDVENSSAARIIVDAHDSDTPSKLIVDHGTTIDQGRLTIGHVGTFEVSTGGATLSGVDVENSHLIQVDAGATLTLDSATINNGTITDLGSIHVIGDSSINSASASGDVAIDADVTLTLNGTTFSGGTFLVSGTLETTGCSAVQNVDVLDGGLLQVNSGNLVVDGTLEGQATIAGASLLELADSAMGAYSAATITFATHADATLKIDHAETFSGAVAGFDDEDKIDLSNVTFDSNTRVTDTDGVLTVFEGDTQVAQIKLDGNYSGAHFAVSSDGAHGTIITEVPGAVSSGLDDNGNAVEGKTLSVAITDAGAAVTNASYSFETWNGESWTPVQTGEGNSFTPGEAQEGQQLRVVLSFDDANGHETSTVSAGIVQESPTETAQIVLNGLVDGKPADRHAITASVHEADAPTSGITYTWTVGGQVVKTGVDGAGATYTPTEADEGKALGVSVSFTDTNHFAETGAISAGIVADNDNDDHHTAPVIDTTLFHLAQDGNDTTIKGLVVTDTDPLALFSKFTVTAKADSGAVVTPANETGSIIKLDADLLLHGITYDPPSDPPQNDKIALTVTDAFGDSDTVNFIFHQASTPSDGPITLEGTPGKDVIFATGGNDILIAHGGLDQFVFKPTQGQQTAEHIVKNFDAGHDTIDLRQFSEIHSWTQVAATAQGQDTLLTIDHNDTILLRNVAPSSLHSSDFIVSPHFGT